MNRPARVIDRRVGCGEVGNCPLPADEAARRIKGGIARAKTEFVYLIRIDNDVWQDDRLEFAASALGQRAQGVIDVTEGAVRLEVTLP